MSGEGELTQLDYLAGRIAKWWLPDDVLFVNELPHTATGKLLKTKLRELHGVPISLQANRSLGFCFEILM